MADDITESETRSGNPFVLMTHPETVLAAVEQSARLAGLNRRLCQLLERYSDTNGTSRPPRQTADPIGARAQKIGPEGKKVAGMGAISSLSQGGLKRGAEGKIPVEQFRDDFAKARGDMNVDHKRLYPNLPPEIRRKYPIGTVRSVLDSKSVRRVSAELADALLAACVQLPVVTPPLRTVPRAFEIELGTFDTLNNEDPRTALKRFRRSYLVAKFQEANGRMSECAAAVERGQQGLYQLFSKLGLQLGRIRGDNRVLPDIQADLVQVPPEILALPYDPAQDEFQRRYFTAQLTRHRFNMAATARAMGLDRSNFYGRAESLGLEMNALRIQAGQNSPRLISGPEYRRFIRKFQAEIARTGRGLNRTHSSLPVDIRQQWPLEDCVAFCAKDKTEASRNVPARWARRLLEIYKTLPDRAHGNNYNK